ncbi:MAG: outer membrane lipoprotein chaperone LolA [Limnobacter sp.]|uniref:outer membrane lipoprotein chaperone LolA n=1 Tax=Limnobacter sp. TaxID=2003368 RepID=UPI00391CB2A8
MNSLRQFCDHTAKASKSVYLALGLSLVSTLAVAAGPAEQALQAFSKNRAYAQGQFSQVVVSASGAVKQKGTGEFAFSRPGKFRWEIQKPYPQLIVADGQNVVSYDPDMMHATRKPIGNALDSTPAALLFGTQDINTLFVVKDEGIKEGKAWLSAKPKDKENLFDTVRLGFQDGLPVQLDIVDALGQTTKLELKNWKFDVKRPASDFAFKAPPGVDLIETK